MGYKQADVDAKLKEVFNDVFRGPNKVYFEVGDSMGYVSDVKNHDARTEGMSYGMMIAVQFGEKDIFDRLWRWSKKYMQHQDGARKGYFAWSCKTDGTRNADRTARARVTSHGAARLTAPAMPRELPATVSCTISRRSSLPPTAGATTPASTTRPRHSISWTAYSQERLSPSPSL